MRPSLPPGRQPHGTESGYLYHVTHKTTPCAKCRKAHTEYRAKERAWRRGRRTVVRQLLQRDLFEEWGAITLEDAADVVAFVEEMGRRMGNIK